MKEAFEKVKERFEEEAEYQYKKCDEADEFEEITVRTARISMAKCYIHAIEIVNQVAEEYNKEYNKEYNTDAPGRNVGDIGKDTNVRTNADYIRSLTDEELANTLIHFDFCDICSPCWAADDCVCTNEEVKEKVVKWLQELKGEK